MNFLFASFRALAAVLAATLLVACAGGPPWRPPPPRLVVFIVIDGLPQWQVSAYRDQLGPDGFARFLDRGAWFTNAHHNHAYTVTASGHASLLTGATPSHHGIIGNTWRDPVTGAEVYNTSDPAATYIGHTTDPLDGTSPRNLKVDTVGDVLRRVTPASKVIGVSGKDRGAILTAGHAGTAYMYMDETGRFASSTYYMQQHPAWVDRFNARGLADGYFKAQWRALLPEAAYARSLPDDQPWFSARNGRLPMTMGAGDAAPGRAFYESLLASPFVDAMSLEFARAAVDGEALGSDDATDILAISLSGHDYVNHYYSAESRLSHDHFLQLDRLLQTFFQALDAAVGKDNYLAMLTSDHGFMPPPELSAARGESSGRIRSAQVMARLSAGLGKRFGPGQWLLGYSGSSLLLDKRLIAQRQLSLDEVADEARALLAVEPGFAPAYTRREFLSGSRAGAPLFEALRNSWHPDVSGEVQYTLLPNWMFGSAGATHGSSYDYDNHVPLLAWGPRWVRPGRVDARVQAIDIAPTLARLLRVDAPAASEGKPLPNAFP